MMQMNFEGGDKDKRKMDDGDLSEDYDYGQEIDKESHNFHQPQDSMTPMTPHI